jgi:hypothetical protein
VLSVLSVVKNSLAGPDVFDSRRQAVLRFRAGNMDVVARGG